MTLQPCKWRTAAMELTRTWLMAPRSGCVCNQKLVADTHIDRDGVRQLAGPRLNQTAFCSGEAVAVGHFLSFYHFLRGSGPENMRCRTVRHPRWGWRWAHQVIHRTGDDLASQSTASNSFSAHDLTYPTLEHGHHERPTFATP